jgi:hypothetical protein
MWTTDDEWDQYVKKVSIQLGFFIFCALMLLVSITRTITTNPGNIPEDKEWDMQSDANLETDGEDDGQDS